MRVQINGEHMTFIDNRLNSYSIGRMQQQQVIPGQFRGIRGTKILGTTFIQNNYYGMGSGFDQYNYFGAGGVKPQLTFWDKLANWTMGAGLLGTVAGGLMSVFSAKSEAAEGRGGEDSGKKSPVDDAMLAALKKANWDIEKQKDGSISLSRNGENFFITKDGKPIDMPKDALTTKPKIDTQDTETNPTNPENTSTDGEIPLDQNRFETALGYNSSNLPNGTSVTVEDGKATVETPYGKLEFDATADGATKAKAALDNYIEVTKTPDGSKNANGIVYAHFNDEVNDIKGVGDKNEAFKLNECETKNDKSLFPKEIRVKGHTLKLQTDSSGKVELYAGKYPTYKLESGTSVIHQDVYALINGTLQQPKGSELDGAGSTAISNRSTSGGGGHR